MSPNEIAVLRRVLEMRGLVGWLSSFVVIGLYLDAVVLFVPASNVTWHWFGVGAVVCASPLGAWFIQSRRAVRGLDRAEEGKGSLRATDASKIVRPYRGAIAVWFWLAPALCLVVLLTPA